MIRNSPGETGTICPREAYCNRPIFAHIKKEFLNMNFNLLPFHPFWITQVYTCVYTSFLDNGAKDTTINIFVHKSLPTLVLTALEEVLPKYSKEYVLLKYSKVLLF